MINRLWSGSRQGTPSQQLPSFHYHTQIVEILQLFSGAGERVTQASVQLGEVNTGNTTHLKQLLCNFMRIVLFSLTKGSAERAVMLRLGLIIHTDVFRLQENPGEMRRKEPAVKADNRYGAICRDTHTRGQSGIRIGSLQRKTAPFCCKRVTKFSRRWRGVQGFHKHALRYTAERVAVTQARYIVFFSLFMFQAFVPHLIQPRST